MSIFEITFTNKRGVFFFGWTLNLNDIYLTTLFIGTLIAGLPMDITSALLCRPSIGSVLATKIHISGRRTCVTYATGTKAEITTL